jgi:ParB family chromosome partitioning protein
MGKRAALADIELPDLLDLGDVAPEQASDGKPLKIDPRSIRPSAWANRHEASFESAEFEELKAEIADAGGNVQPIKVRPLAIPDGEICYEIVFGHRRHRACLDLGLEVAAVIEDVDDQKLWAQMERENRSRANLSAWEQGMMYQRALDAGLFPSMLALAKAIGRDQGNVSKAISIAKLPGAVVEAFPSPHDLRFCDAKDLKDAVAKAPVAVVEVAKGLAAEPKARPAPEVLKALMGAAEEGVVRCIPANDAHSARGGGRSTPSAKAPESTSASSPQRWALDGKTGAMREAKKGEWVRWADVEAAFAGKATR